MAGDPKEYIELFEDKNLNKKHKSIKKGSSEPGFESFPQRIKSLGNFHTFEKPPCDTKKVSRLTVLVGEMVKTNIIKNEFCQLNDKRFYFPDGIVSLPFHHPVLAEVNEFKQKKGPKN